MIPQSTMLQNAISQYFPLLQISTWLKNAMQTQIALQLDTPLNYVNFAGSHNSAIARAYGFGIEEQGIQKLVTPYFGNSSRVYIANQEFSLTDQLNMGLRHLELDTHWWKKEVRICHAGGVHMSSRSILLFIFDLPLMRPFT
jgi:hypothetical protein